MAELTPAELRVYTKIREHIEATGASPTFRGLAEELQRSKVTIFAQVEALIAKGYLRHITPPRPLSPSVAGRRYTAGPNRNLALTALRPSTPLLAAAEAVVSGARVVPGEPGKESYYRVPAAAIKVLAQAIECGQGQIVHILRHDPEKGAIDAMLGRGVHAAEETAS